MTTKDFMARSAERMAEKAARKPAARLRTTMSDNKISAADFAAYVIQCRDRGISDIQLATSLGCGIGSIYNWKRIDPPRYIGLAIAALEKGLKPWRNTK
jgi:hypothetical protein